MPICAAYTPSTPKTGESLISETTEDLLGLETTDTVINTADEAPAATLESDETSTCNLVDDDLLSSDVTATVVYTAASYETEKYNDFNKQKFELERL